MMRITIVDDDADLVMAMSALLRMAGAEVPVEAHSVDELQSHAADALVCDVALLDINLGPERPTGLDAYQWLRERGFTGSIVFLTGHARTNALVEAACQTANTAVLTKPVDADVLIRLVEQS